MSAFEMGYPTGRRVETSGRPENWMGTVGSHNDATPVRLDHVRRFYRQLDVADFTVVGKTWVERESGREYRRVPGDPLLSERPEDCDVRGFVVEDGEIVYLRDSASDGRKSSQLIGTGLQGIVVDQTPVEDGEPRIL